MENESNGRSLTIKRLKAVKSAYILEADASMSRGLEATAMGLFVKAAELELELAECFQSRSEQLDAQISRFSAASCYFRARQYQLAAALLREMPKEFPKAQGLLVECEGKEDVPLTVPTPRL